MKNRSLFISLVLISHSMGAFAQSSNQATPVIETYGVPQGQQVPVSAAPIEAPAMNTETPPPVAPAPVAEQQTPTVAQAPLAPTTPAPVTVPDDGTLKGVGLSFSIGAYPVAFDNQLVGVGAPSETGKWYFNLKPNAALSTAFKTDGGRKVSFGLGYTLDYREYYNKATTKRFFEHDVDGSIGIDWSPIVSTSIPVTFSYAIKTGTDLAEDNSLGVETLPTIAIKPNKAVTFKLQYHILYSQGLRDVGLDGVNASSGGGGGSSTATDDYYDGEFDYTGGTGYGFTATGLATPSSATINPEWVMHRIILGSSYKPVDSTTLGAVYAYKINQFSTNDAEESSGHFMTLSISQNLFKGNTVGLSDEVRFLKSKSATVDDGSLAQSFRNRLMLTIQQDITANMKFDLLYRWQLTASSKDNYSEYTPSHWFYSGVIFSF